MSDHEGMDPNDLTEPNPITGDPGRIAGGIKAAFKLPPGGAVENEKLDNISKAIAAAVVNEIKNHAKITITIDAGPPITATATIE